MIYDVTSGQLDIQHCSSGDRNSQNKDTIASGLLLSYRNYMHLLSLLVFLSSISSLNIDNYFSCEKTLHYHELIHLLRFVLSVGLTLMHPNSQSYS